MLICLIKDWPDIGFNYIVGEDGNIYEGRGWDEVGAHTKGHNYDVIGELNSTHFRS